MTAGWPACPGTELGHGAFPPASAGAQVLQGTQLGTQPAACSHPLGPGPEADSRRATAHLQLVFPECLGHTGGFGDPSAQ